MRLCLVLSVLFVAVALSFRTAETRPNSGPRQIVESYPSLEQALRRLLKEVTCRELNASELNIQFTNNGSIPFSVRKLVKSIDIPLYTEQDRPTGCYERIEHPIHFLDYRQQSNDCSRALPALRLIDSTTQVFPAYYMDWECGTGCTEQRRCINNYVLLQRTDTCSDGTADWRTIDASEGPPLNVIEGCIPT